MSRTSIVILVLLLSLAPQVRGADSPLRLAYAPWSSAIASAHLVQAVLQERLGQPCTLVRLNAREVWQAVAEGEADAMVCAWLPHTHARYREQFGARVKDLGPNLTGTRIGLVVPDVTAGRLSAGTGLRNRPYMDIDSIEELDAHAGRLRGRIIGIEPEAGIMHAAREARAVYRLDNLRLVEGSEVSMIAELTAAVRHQEWIVVTGWLPHWMFARWELKFLDDPRGVFGASGHISTLARRGLREERPRVHRFLDNFVWKPEDMGQLMLWIQEDGGRYPYEKALRWMRTHPDRVTAWLR